MKHTNRLDVRLITCAEADRIYRRREGTTKDLVRAGLLKAQRRGRITYVSAKRAEELLGLDS